MNTVFSSKSWSSREHTAPMKKSSSDVCLTQNFVVANYTLNDTSISIVQKTRSPFIRYRKRAKDSKKQKVSFVSFQKQMSGPELPECSCKVPPEPGGNERIHCDASAGGVSRRSSSIPDSCAEIDSAVPPTLCESFSLSTRSLCTSFSRAARRVCNWCVVLSSCTM